MALSYIVEMCAVPGGRGVAGAPLQCLGHAAGRRVGSRQERRAGSPLVRGGPDVGEGDARRAVLRFRPRGLPRRRRALAGDALGPEHGRRGGVREPQRRRPAADALPRLGQERAAERCRLLPGTARHPASGEPGRTARHGAAAALDVPAPGDLAHPVPGRPHPGPAPSGRADPTGRARRRGGTAAGDPHVQEAGVAEQQEPAGETEHRPRRA